MEDEFTCSRLSELNRVNWDDQHHRRRITASLVKGTYVLEQDVNPDPRWWEFFNFELHCIIRDSDDGSIFGAIYKLKDPDTPRAPKYVIAFRGTILKNRKDLKLDWKIISNGLHRSSRVQIGIDRVRQMVDSVGADNILLAGHSLGSAIALIVGLGMTMMGFYIDSYLFNPPFPPVPLEPKMEIFGAHLAKFCQNSQDDPFATASTWTPYLFVNPRDLICSEYIGYFEGPRWLANSTSLRSDSLPFHLIPTAYLTIYTSDKPKNRCLLRRIKNEHELSQWWNPDIHDQLRSQLYWNRGIE